MFQSMTKKRISKSETLIRASSANLLRRKCLCGHHTLSCEECAEYQRNRRSMRGGVRGGSSHYIPHLVHEVLHSPGYPLNQATRDFMESRFGHGFSHVRIHTGTRAAESARAIQSRAYTTGSHIVFGTGQYRPQADAGKQLLAHELTHVMQQCGGTVQSNLVVGDPSDRYEQQADSVSRSVMQTDSEGGIHCGVTSVSQPGNVVSGVVQRVGIWEAIVRFFGGGTFSEEELLTYLETLDRTREIEGHYDSDNKAREVVRRWRLGDTAFANLHVPRRILLIREMLSGFTGNEDERAILALLEESLVSERNTILAAVGRQNLRSNLHGEERRRLDTLLELHESELPSSRTAWTPQGVMEILHRHGDEQALRTLIEGRYRIMSFNRAYATWEYPDGRREEKERRGLRGMTCRAHPDTWHSCPREKEIWIRAGLTNEEAASTLFHEAEHVQFGPSTSHQEYLMQEVQVRIATEEFRIRHGLPATRPAYRNPDGTVNEEKIRYDVISGRLSQFYSPQGRKIVAMRFEPDNQEVVGWRLP